MNIYDEILNIHSLAGGGEETEKLIAKKACGLGYSVKNDGGAVIAEKDGKGRRIMIACTASESGCLITGTTKNRADIMFFDNINPVVWLGTGMRSENGCYGVLRSEKENKSETGTEDLYLDFGIPCKENKIETNSFALPCSETVRSGNIIFGNGLSSKSGMAVLLSALEKCADSDLNLCFAFLQGRPGTSSAEAIAAKYRPDCLITVFGYAADKNFSVGKGAGILLKDGNAVAGEDMRSRMIDAADSLGIPYQLYIGKRNPLNEKLSISGGGAHLCGICIPVDGLGDPVESVSSEDIEKSVNLLLKVIAVL